MQKKQIEQKNILEILFLGQTDLEDIMVRSFGLGIPGTPNVYIEMSVLLVVTSGNKS